MIAVGFCNVYPLAAQKGVKELRPRINWPHWHVRQDLGMPRTRSDPADTVFILKHQFTRSALVQPGTRLMR